MCVHAEVTDVNEYKCRISVLQFLDLQCLTPMYYVRGVLTVCTHVDDLCTLETMVGHSDFVLGKIFLQRS